VDKGLGACVLAAGLKRNAEEGFPGHYYGIDSNPKAGFLFSGEYKTFGEIVYGNSVECLKTLDVSIDLFINDSDHRRDYEAEEYRIIAPRLNDKSIVLGDNSHGCDALLEFALSSGRRFLFFQEKPSDHWYPGSGIGIAFKR
jgi:hypothetical protein